MLKKTFLGGSHWLRRRTRRRPRCSWLPYATLSPRGSRGAATPGTWH